VLGTCRFVRGRKPCLPVFETAHSLELFLDAPTHFKRDNEGPADVSATKLSVRMDEL
jgi:hypothetical protein